MAKSDFDLMDMSLTVGVAGIAGGMAYLVGDFVSAFVTSAAGVGSALASVPYAPLLGAGVFAGLGFMEIRKMYRDWKAQA